MNPIENNKSALALLKKQRSHILIVLSNAQPGEKAAFLNWYNSEYRTLISETSGVLAVQNFEQHEIDVTQGQYQKLSFHYLSLIELTLDGAEQARDLIEKILALHNTEPSAQKSATWLYYPVSEKVGREPVSETKMMTLAFANALPGAELGFREWYCTRHIRHAMNIPALVSGQCFELTKYQQHGEQKPDYSIIAIYEQEGTPEEMIESFKNIEPNMLDFPALDLNPGRFAEWVYRAV